MVQKLGSAEGVSGPRKWHRALSWANVASSTSPGGKGLTLIIKKKKGNLDLLLPLFISFIRALMI